MELTEVQIYIALVIGTATAVGFVISGVKFLNKKWSDSINNHIDKKLVAILALCSENTTKIDKLEQRVKDLRDYFFKGVEK